MKRLRPYIKGDLKEMILGPLFKLLEALFELLVPILLAKMIDTYIVTHNKTGVLMVVLQLVGLAGLGLCFSLTAQFYSSKAAVGFTKAMTDSLFAKIMALSQSQQNKIGASSLLSRLTSDSFQVQTGINLFLRLFLRAPIIVFGAIIMAYLISPTLTLIFLIMVLILFVIIVVLSIYLNPLFLKGRQFTDQLVRLTSQQLEGIRVIKDFGQTSREIEAFSQKNKELSLLQIQIAKIANSLNPLTFLVVNLSLVVLIWQGSIDISNGLISQGMLVALINYLMQILAELLKMTMLVANINQSVTSAKRISQIFELKDENFYLQETLSSLNQAHLLEVSHLNFTYPGASSYSLKGIHFSADKGEWLGILGGTGSGKSTLIDLICHLYPIKEGNLSLYLDGHTPTSQKEWRQQVALVPQKAQLFQGTIRSNLLLGQSEAITDECLWKALKIAQAKSFVTQLPEQLEAKVEAFGRNFSGGQRQRLAIARALVVPKPTLILDDASSALDNITSAKLFKALKAVYKDALVIVVTQSTRLIPYLDKILLLEKGKQVAFDRPDKLKVTNSFYQELLALQDEEDM
ncbi:ABC transporter ATP-binding protein [Streptococcus ictaluri]|uniref:ABC transporter transmembrane region n=1 Tax=Streptococcus ictaluri 707-05 TaxID=764299 RepID=G5K3C9_9STRE|nr:ABC transporter ATP-binding protein [Streptococcus ictaluri]EHI69642.1 ABC transporter transmembrane region [Streptococcus ictaluri 707-05]